MSDGLGRCTPSPFPPFFEPFRFLSLHQFNTDPHRAGKTIRGETWYFACLPPATDPLFFSRPLTLFFSPLLSQWSSSPSRSQCQKRDNGKICQFLYVKCGRSPMFDQPRLSFPPNNFFFPRAVFRVPILKGRGYQSLFPLSVMNIATTPFPLFLTIPSSDFFPVSSLFDPFC